MKAEPKQSQIGRRKLSELERLRAKVWYCAVKQRGNWSDYKLDMQFGQGEGPISTGGEGRTRVFGVIKNKGTMPTEGANRFRKFNLIERVESHPQFKGTRNVIDSPFWDLLLHPPSDLETTRDFVNRCLERLGLIRLTGRAAFDWRWYASDQFDLSQKGSLRSTGSSPFETSLNNAIEELPCNLDLIALLGGLYREACLSFNPDHAHILGSYFKLELNKFCSFTWMKSYGRFLEDASINRILYGKREYVGPAGTVDIFDLAEIDVHGFLVANDNPKLKSFMENRENISLALKQWITSMISTSKT